MPHLCALRHFHTRHPSLNRVAVGESVESHVATSLTTDTWRGTAQSRESRGAGQQEVRRARDSRGERGYPVGAVCSMREGGVPKGDPARAR